MLESSAPLGRRPRSSSHFLQLIRSHVDLGSSTRELSRRDTGLEHLVDLGWCPPFRFGHEEVHKDKPDAGQTTK